MKTSSIRLASAITRTPRSRKPASAAEPGPQLALAAVDHDEVRERREACVVGRVVRRDVQLALPLRMAPREHLGHRRVVVGGARRRADREAPVVGLLRRGPLEDDHRGDRVGAAEVGDVEALDPDRGRVEPERLLQALERLHRGSGGGARRAGAPGRARAPRCARRARGCAASRRARRRASRAARRGGWRAPPASASRPASSRGTTSSAGIAAPPAVVLEHELLGHLGRLALGLVRQVERLAVAEDPVAHLEHLRVGVPPVERDRHRVEGARPRRPPPAGARAASARPAGGCARAWPARSAPRRPPRASAARARARCSRSARRGSRPRRRCSRGNPPG